jgi:hypothetical protein
MGLAADSSEAQSTPAGLFRRLGAILSDGLVLVGLLLLYSFCFSVPVLHVLDKKAMVPSEVGWVLTLVYRGSLLALCFGFYGYFWAHSGQTIGMRAWRLKLISVEGSLLNWRQAFLRWLIAMMPWVCCLFLLDMAESLGSFLLELIALVVGGLGVLDFLSMYGHTDRLCWHDKKSSSKIILLPER